MDLNPLLVTTLLNIGRHRMHCSGRPLDFYTRSVVATKLATPNRNFMVFGNVTEVCDLELSYTDLIELVGPAQFNRIEKSRCLAGRDVLQDESTWYLPLTLSKLFLLEKVLKDNPAAAGVFWVDAGLWSHGFMQIELLDLMVVRPGFHIVRSGYGQWGWHGRDVGKLLPFPGFLLQGALFGGDRAAVLNVVSSFRNLLDSWLSHNVVPLEEDLLTYMGVTGMAHLTQHTDFDTLARFHQ